MKARLYKLIFTGFFAFFAIALTDTSFSAASHKSIAYYIAKRFSATAKIKKYAARVTTVIQRDNVAGAELQFIAVGHGINQPSTYRLDVTLTPDYQPESASQLFASYQFPLSDQAINELNIINHTNSTISFKPLIPLFSHIKADGIINLTTGHLGFTDVESLPIHQSLKFLNVSGDHLSSQAIRGLGRLLKNSASPDVMAMFMLTGDNALPLASVAESISVIPKVEPGASLEDVRSILTAQKQLGKVYGVVIDNGVLTKLQNNVLNLMALDMASASSSVYMAGFQNVYSKNLQKVVQGIAQKTAVGKVSFIDFAGTTNISKVKGFTQIITGYGGKTPLFLNLSGTNLGTKDGYRLLKSVNQRLKMSKAASQPLAPVAFDLTSNPIYVSPSFVTVVAVLQIQKILDQVRVNHEASFFALPTNYTIFQTKPEKAGEQDIRPRDFHAFLGNGVVLVDGFAKAARFFGMDLSAFTKYYANLIHGVQGQEKSGQYGRLNFVFGSPAYSKTYIHDLFVAFSHVHPNRFSDISLIGDAVTPQMIHDTGAMMKEERILPYGLMLVHSRPEPPFVGVREETNRFLASYPTVRVFATNVAITSNLKFTNLLSALSHHHLIALSLPVENDMQANAFADFLRNHHGLSLIGVHFGEGVSEYALKDFLNEVYRYPVPSKVLVLSFSKPLDEEGLSITRKLIALPGYANVSSPVPKTEAYLQRAGVETGFAAETNARRIIVDPYDKDVS